MFTIDKDKASTTPWGRVDKSMMRNRLVKAIDEDGAADAVREVYAGVLSDSLTDSPSKNWVLPHHELQGDSVVLNRDGLGAAAQRLDQVDAPAEKKRAMAEHLARHYRALGVDVPPILAKFLTARLDAVGTDGPYIVTDQPVALIQSGKRYGADAGRQDWGGLTKDDVTGLVRNWERMGKPELPVEHGAHGAMYVAGFIYDMWTDADANGELTLMGAIKWTHPAANEISVGALPGMSVELLKDVKDNMTGADLPGWSIHAAALLARPFYDNLQKVELGGIAINEFTNEYRVALSAVGNQPGEKKMDKEICKLLGLPETATAEDARAAITALSEKASATSDKAKALDAAEQETGMKLSAIVAKAKTDDKSGEVATLRAQLTAVTDDLKVFKQERDALKLSALKKECDEFIADGQKTGRIATKPEVVTLWREQFTASPEKAKAFLATFPESSVVGGQTGVGHGQAGADDDGDPKVVAQTKLALEAAALAVELQAKNPKLSIGDAQAQAFAQLSKGKA